MAYILCSFSFQPFANFGFFTLFLRTFPTFHLGSASLIFLRSKTAGRVSSFAQRSMFRAAFASMSTRNPCFLLRFRKFKRNLHVKRNIAEKDSMHRANALATTPLLELSTHSGDEEKGATRSVKQTHSSNQLQVLSHANHIRTSYTIP